MKRNTCAYHSMFVEVNSPREEGKEKRRGLLCSVPWGPGRSPKAPPSPPSCSASSSPSALLQPSGARGLCWQTEGLELQPTLAFVPRPSSSMELFFTTTPSPSTSTGAFGLSPLHSACIGEMFPVPEGMKGLGLVSMTTGRKRNNSGNLIS